MLFSQFSMFCWMKLTTSSLKSTRQWSWTANWTPLPTASGGITMMCKVTSTKYTMVGGWVRDSAQQADSVSMSRVVLHVVRWQSILYSHKTADATILFHTFTISKTAICRVCRRYINHFYLTVNFFMSGRPIGSRNISHRHFPFVSISRSSLLSAMFLSTTNTKSFNFHSLRSAAHPVTLYSVDRYKHYAWRSTNTKHTLSKKTLGQQGLY